LVTCKSFELFTSDFDSVLCAGLFSPSHMTYRLDRLRSGSNEEPTLADMTEKAMRILRRGNNGYFLLVEGYLMWSSKPPAIMPCCDAVSVWYGMVY